MKIRISQPYALNEIGGRENNEDAIFPAKGTASDKQIYFMVCDGIGGAEKGEVASTLACQSFGECLADYLPVSITPKIIDTALDYTQQRFDSYLRTNPSSSGMGTTLTFVAFTDEGVVAAHVGDSRIYQIRNGKVLFRTWDHSLVSELVQNGIITEEEARSHPQRNVITRAIQGYSVSKTQADTTLLKDVQAGDYFFMCTDGILERISDDLLCSILSWNMTDREKMAAIENECEGKTIDNFSAYLIRVSEVMEEQADKIIANRLSDSLIQDKREKVTAEEKVEPEVIDKKHSRWRWFYWLFIGILAIAFVYSLLDHSNSRKRFQEGLKTEEPIKPMPVRMKKTNRLPADTHKIRTDSTKKDKPHTDIPDDGKELPMSDDKTANTQDNN